MKRWVILGVALLVGACSAATSDEYEKLPLGYTGCAQRGVGGPVVPYSYIRLDALASDEAQQIAAHEHTHGMTVRLFATCREFNQWASKPENKLRMETVAFCSSAQVWSVTKQVPFDSAVAKYAYWLANGYTFGIDVDSARTLIMQTCQPPTT